MKWEIMRLNPSTHMPDSVYIWYTLFDLTDAAKADSVD